MIAQSPCTDERANVVVVIALVSAEVLRLPQTRQRRHERHALEDRRDLRLVMAVGSGDDQPNGQARCFRQKVPFRALLAPISRVSAGRLST